MRKPWNRGGIRTWFLFIGFMAALAGYATPLMIASGALLVLFSMLIQFWSKGCLHQQREVSRTGPYRFVRHPFYLGNIILDTGIVLMSGFLPLIVIAPVWWILVYFPVMRREEKTLTAMFGDEYRQYMARVPMIVPWRRPLPQRGSSFSWFCDNILKTEIPRAIRYVSYPLVFLLIWRITTQGISVFMAPSLFDLIIISAIVSVTASRAVWLHHFRNHDTPLIPRPLLPTQLLQIDLRIIMIMTIIAVGLLMEAIIELRTDWIHWLPGLLFLGISIISLLRFRHMPLLSEGTLAVCMAMLFELEWMGLLLIPFYLALILDNRLRALSPHKQKALQSLSIPSYLTIIIIGFVTALVAEIWIPVAIAASL